MNELENLAAWAKTMGFDPTIDYVNVEFNEPEAPSALPPGRLSRNFTEDEFRCRGTGTLPVGGMDRELIRILQKIRDHYGVPVIITSGYRSVTHNRSVGGAPNSQHILGRAADFRAQGVSPADVFRWLNPQHEGGLGSYVSFTHIDTRDSRARW